MSELHDRLLSFQIKHKLWGKGALAQMLHISRLAVENGLPLDPSACLTSGKGQVLGLGKARVQAILSDHGITRVLAEEGGRTSRGSLGYLQEYMTFLNELHEASLFDVFEIEDVEAWWIGRVKAFFDAKPLPLKYDVGKSLCAIVHDLLGQAQKRQKASPGMMYVGAVLQHLVGAKISLILPDVEMKHHGFSVADRADSRDGDFIIDDVVIHVTTAPGEALLRKCAANIDAGLRPIIVTLGARIAAAESNADDIGLEGRVDIFDAEQFIATNVYEWSRFNPSDRKLTIEKLIDRYNKIVESCETDVSLKIAIG